MGTLQSDYNHLKPYFTDSWQIHEHNERVERARYQLLADIETTRVTLLDTSISRRDHWYVGLVPDDDRTRVKPIYGAFEPPADAMHALPLVQCFVNAHPSRRGVFIFVEVVCMPYAPKDGMYNLLIDHWVKQSA